MRVRVRVCVCVCVRVGILLSHSKSLLKGYGCGWIIHAVVKFLLEGVGYLHDPSSANPPSAIKLQRSVLSLHLKLN